MQPLVSVVLPVYNGASYLQETLDSISGQTYGNIELIAINDGSTDTSLSILKRANVDVLLDVENGGVARARNLGIEHSKGEFICFIDQDDLWAPNKTALQVKKMMLNSDYMYGICQQQMFVIEGDAIPSWCKQEWLEQPKEGYLPSALILRRELLQGFKLFDPTMPVTSDIDMFFRLKEKKIPFFNNELPLIRRRVHNENQSADTEVCRTEVLKTIREAMLRRRKEQA